MSDKKVLLINTGGTASAIRTTRGKGVNLGAIDRLITEMLPLAEVHSWKPILSQNLQWSRLDDFYGAFKTRLSDARYCRAYILHGTDTMAYMAGFLCRSIDAAYPIFLIGTQRSPDNPGWQLPPLLRMLQAPALSRVDPTVYVVNYVDPTTLELIHPRTVFKAKSYSKGCYKGLYGPEYLYKNGHLTRVRRTRRILKPYSGFKAEEIPVVYVTPATSSLPSAQKVLLIPYGLGNIPERLVPVIKSHNRTKYYMANNLEGSKHPGIYRSKVPRNLIVSPYSIQYTLLSLVLS